MRKICLLCISLILTACTVVPTPATLPIASTPTLTPSPSSTPVMLTKLSGPADLYSAPGNGNYDFFSTLPAGTNVVLTGSFGDFYQIQSGSQTGFIAKSSLSIEPANLPALKVDQVPWTKVYGMSCADVSLAGDSNDLVFTPASEQETDTNIAQFKITTPLKIKFQLEVTSQTPWAGLKLQGAPGGNPWWKGILRMDVSLNNGHYALAIRDGRSESYAVTLDTHAAAKDNITLLFSDPQGKQLQILDASGQTLDTFDLTKTPNLLLPNGLFPTGDVWVGSTVGFPGSMTIRQLSLEEQPTGRWDAAAQTGPGLRSLTARDGITTATEFNSYLAADPRYCRTMQRDFDVAVISEFSDKNIWLGPGQYNFEPLDHEVDVAHRLGHNIYASHLVWGATESGVIPDWLLKGKFTREQYLNILEQHIKTIVGRYKDRVQEWSIANEAPNRDFYSGFDFWYDHIGPEYIEKSFQWAHEADPNAILIFNADNNESPRDQITAGNIDRMYNTVKTLKAKGVPIDVVGMQMHLLLPWNSKVLPKKEDVIATMQKFAALGVKVYITEMDVNLHGRPGTEEEKLQFEADLYQEMVSACVESGVCTRFSTWGISDSNSWETCQNDYCPIKNMDAAPLMFDANFHPKPAYEAVRAVLSGVKP